MNGRCSLGNDSLEWSGSSALHADTIPGTWDTFVELHRDSTSSAPLTETVRTFRETSGRAWPADSAAITLAHTRPPH